MWKKFLFIWLPIVNCVWRFLEVVLSDNEPSVPFPEILGTDDLTFVLIFLSLSIATIAAFTHATHRTQPGMALWFRFNIFATLLGLSLGCMVNVALHREGWLNFIGTILFTLFFGWYLRWSWRNYAEAVVEITVDRSTQE